MIGRNLLAAAAIAALLAGCGGKGQGVPETETTGSVQAHSQTTPASATTTGSAGGTLSNTTDVDKEFVSKAGASGLAEVQMGNLALQRAASPAVKEYARKMVADHQRAAEELSQLATMKGLALPTELGQPHKGGLEHLTMLNGAEFDKAYMQHMVGDHETAVADFEKAAIGASDSDVKAWAAKMLPTLKEHLQTAKDVAIALK